MRAARNEKQDEVDHRAKRRTNLSAHITGRAVCTVRDDRHHPEKEGDGVGAQGERVQHYADGEQRLAVVSFLFGFHMVSPWRYSAKTIIAHLHRKGNGGGLDKFRTRVL